MPCPLGHLMASQALVGLGVTPKWQLHSAQTWNYFRFSSWGDVVFYQMAYLHLLNNQLVFILQLINVLCPIVDFSVLTHLYIPRVNLPWSKWIIFVVCCRIWLDIFLRIFTSLFIGSSVLVLSVMFFLVLDIRWRYSNGVWENFFFPLSCFEYIVTNWN